VLGELLHSLGVHACNPPDAPKVQVVDTGHLLLGHLMLHEEIRLAMQTGHPDKDSPELQTMQEAKKSGLHSFHSSIGMR
jgi:hypothetical protein